MVCSLLAGKGFSAERAVEQKTLSGHVLPQIKAIRAIGDLPATNEMRLALGVPLRDAAGLEVFLQSVSDPQSPNYRHYLTPEEFTARFGPTEKDYAAVKQFAFAQGLTVVGEHANRQVLDVRGSVANVQRAFQVKLKKYSHPTEAREFFAPENEPIISANLPVADVTGLNNFKTPHPKSVRQKSDFMPAVPHGGSGPGGAYFGGDFRNAYAPDTALTGAGQTVGLLQFDGFYASDIAAFQAAANLPNIPVQTVLLDGYDGTPGAANDEVALDIEMAMSMAPGLTRVIVFSGGPNGYENDILSSMAASNTVKQFSCSWGWSGGPRTTTENLFKQMISQGQSFFNASGDSDAFTLPVNSTNAVDNPFNQNAPSSSPYITQVGGTYLSMSGGSWTTETVWNAGGGVGSSGGISTYYSIPSWQAGTSMANNQGSTSRRNIPDVAMVASHIYVYSSNGQTGSWGGTSLSAPLWAGFAALINQQAAALGKPPIGFVNPAIYNLGNSANYANAFHDVTSGNNTSPDSLANFYAAPGYDLCTGWGSPTGQRFIDALLGSANTMQFSSADNFTASGGKGGPFNPLSPTISMVNTGTVAVSWALVNSNGVNWLKVTPSQGTLGAGAQTDLALNFTAGTSNLLVGNYTARLLFSNYTARAAQTVPFTLQVVPSLFATPATGFVGNGAAGGPFDVSGQVFTLLNRSADTTPWKVISTANWLTISPTNKGTIAGNFGTDSFTITLNTNANLLPEGAFNTAIYLFNGLNQLVQRIPISVKTGQNIVSNGGFETGNFRGWSLNANYTFVTNRVNYVHSGYWSAMLGQQNTLGDLSQTLPTVAGQTYQVSLWLKNPTNTHGATPNEFTVLWEGNSIYDQVNIPYTNALHLQFNVTATSYGSALQFGFYNNPYYLSIDDVVVKPIQPVP